MNKRSGRMGLLRSIIFVGVILFTGCVVSSNVDLHAETAKPDVTFATPPTQSGVTFGHVQPEHQVSFGDQPLRVDDDGQFLIGFDRDAELAQELTVTDPQGRTHAFAFDLEPRDDYEIQRIDGLPPGKVTPRSQEVIDKITRERALIAAVKTRNSDGQGPATLDLIWPATGPITGIYGSQRILNGQPRAWHRGIDVAAPVGTPIASILPGEIALAQTDMHFTGGTVFVDHGRGLMSVYAHMDEVMTVEGATVEQGEIIGTIGATGRVTGPHLHWGMYFFDQIIDPMPLLPPMPE